MRYSAYKDYSNIDSGSAWFASHWTAENDGFVQEPLKKSVGIEKFRGTCGWLECKKHKR